jgi:hypothetical protein
MLKNFNLVRVRVRVQGTGKPPYMVMPKLALPQQQMQALAQAQYRITEIGLQTEAFTDSMFLRIRSILPAKARPVLNHFVSMLGGNVVAAKLGITKQAQKVASRQVEALRLAMPAIVAEANEAVEANESKRGKRVKNRAKAMEYQVRKIALKQDFLVDVFQRARGKMKNKVALIPGLLEALREAAASLGASHKDERDNPIAWLMMTKGGEASKGNGVDRMVELANVLAAEYGETISRSAVYSAMKAAGIKFRRPKNNLRDPSYIGQFVFKRLKAMVQIFHLFSAHISLCAFDRKSLFRCNSDGNNKSGVWHVDETEAFKWKHEQQQVDHSVGSESAECKLSLHTTLGMPSNGAIRTMQFTDLLKHHSGAAGGSDTSAVFSQREREDAIASALECMLGTATDSCTERWSAAKYCKDTSGYAWAIGHVEVLDPECAISNITDVLGIIHKASAKVRSHYRPYHY